MSNMIKEMEWLIHLVFEKRLKSKVKPATWNETNGILSYLGFHNNICVIIETKNLAHILRANSVHKI